MVVPRAAVRWIVAWTVIVTEPPLGRLPSQVTVFVGASATAVPDVALAETRVRVEGSVSTNSWPGLLACVAFPVLARVMV